MKKGLKILFIILIVCLSGLLLFPLVFSFNPIIGQPALEFPVENPANITNLAAFNTPNWGEPGINHNGVDLSIKGHNYTRINSPCRGVVVFISSSINAYKGHIMIHISIMVNYQCIVNLVLEPFSNDSAFIDLQKTLINVKVGSIVIPNQQVALLLEGPENPHLHYMVNYNGKNVCPFDYSTDSAKAKFTQIAADSNTTYCVAD